jgi:hypothetical protein
MKTKNKLRIEKSKYPTDEITHVLWLETESLCGSGYRGIFKGTYQECLIEKEKLENKPKSKRRGIRAWILSH